MTIQNVGKRACWGLDRAEQAAEGRGDLLGRTIQLAKSARSAAVRDVAFGAEPLRRIIKDEGGVRAGELLDELQAEFGSGIETEWLADKLSVQLFLDDLRKEWGPGRLERALERCASDLEYRACEGLPLLVRDVNQIVHELADPQQEDIEEFWSAIRKVCEHPQWRGSSLFSARQQRSLEAERQEGDEDLYAVARRLFAAQCDRDVAALDTDLFAVLCKGVFCSHDEIDGMLQGRRIPGVITGYPLGGLLKQLFYSRDYEIRERLQLYEQLSQEPVSDEAFDELLAKALVKKRLVKGMLVPRKIVDKHKRERTVYYRVDEMLRTGFGKLAYHLVPANYNEHDLDDILLFRSTASNPFMADSALTLLQDFYPDKPPGYKWNEYGQAAEREIFFGRGNQCYRGLRVVGHSLGGSHAQLSLASRILGTHGAKPDLPVRPIKLVTFDSPAIDHQDAMGFQAWVQNPANAARAKNIQIKHYFSDWDPVPGSGDKHLGYGCEEKGGLNVSTYVFSKLESGHPRLDFHPHGRHWLWTKEGTDYLRKRVKLIDFDDAAWRRYVELGRKLVGKALFKPALTLFQKWRAIMA